MGTKTFRRQNEDGWSVYYKVGDEGQRLLDMKALVAAATDDSTDYGEILTRLLLQAALKGVSVQTESIDESKKEMHVVLRSVGDTGELQ
jgi:hypothetical protein